MKTKFKYLISALLLFICCFSFVGCNAPSDASPVTPSDDTKIVFSDYFLYNSSSAYKGTFDVIRVSDLSEPAFFEKNEFELRDNLTLSHISFEICSNSSESENLYVSIYTKTDGIYKASCVSEQLTISSVPTKVDFYYVSYDRTGGEGFRTSVVDGCTIKNTTITKNTTFTIYYGTEVELLDLNNNLYAKGEYEYPISIQNFIIE